MKNVLFYRVGEHIGNGWIIVSIQRLYQGVFIDNDKYIELTYFKRKEKKKTKIRKIIEVIFDK
ncbi:MAG: hypothetical protein ACLTAK_01345 [Bacilli bacterium]